MRRTTHPAAHPAAGTAAEPTACSADGTGSPGCGEFERAASLGRRGFLNGLAGATGAMVATQLFGDAVMQASFGASATDNVLVVLSLRGGIDGLGMVVPHGDPGYYRARPTTNVPRSTVIAADSMFGLHPQMAPLLPLWNARKFAAVHAVGMEVPNRSHFKATEEVEDADPTSSVRRGWVNRMIGAGGIVGVTEAVHLSSPLAPTMMAGPAPFLSTDSFDNLQIPAANESYWAPKRYAAENLLWGAENGPLGAAARSALQVSKGLATTMAKPYKPANGAVYPTEWPAGDLAGALKDTAHLIKADVGTSVISIDYGSWDMHSDYGTNDWGQMQSMTGAVATSLAAFFADLGPLADRVTLATISEFGRRLSENGNRGFDHGWGNMMLVMGGGVRGGQYYGRWPGLLNGTQLADDVTVTTDYRNVLGEIVTRRFPDRPLATVFPGLTYSPLGLMA